MSICSGSLNQVCSAKFVSSAAYSDTFRLFCLQFFSFVMEFIEQLESENLFSNTAKKSLKFCKSGDLLVFRLPNHMLAVSLRYLPM
ncbi:hypothetical protein AYI70_g10469 [Smittium culicis]|uniref:Uncharacterized protein n=1 Tax=Smittium culicis TaxID=133412 RepID=A0A1R1X6E2_9FUNG|nr:hypothetical protein AYI70_g11048 [Smittium culicis]OMJ10206.1 hypothetical protein AYI70_g10469 [Smittium culicis]